MELERVPRLVEHAQGPLQECLGRLQQQSQYVERKGLLQGLEESQPTLLQHRQGRRKESVESAAGRPQASARTHLYLRGHHLPGHWYGTRPGGALCTRVHHRARGQCEDSRRTSSGSTSVHPAHDLFQMPPLCHVARSQSVSLRHRKARSRSRLPVQTHEAGHVHCCHTQP